MKTRDKRIRWIVPALCGAGLIVLARWPVTTRIGVDYQEFTRSVPLYEKAINFLSRDLQTRRFAAEVAQGAAKNDEQKLLKIFLWVTRNIHPTPSGFPVVDDHPLHILIRGYGAKDQRTEAFALLANYAGFPATLAKLNSPGATPLVDVAVVRCQKKTLLFDVVRRLYFTDERGQLADIDELANHPEWIARVAHQVVVDGVPYERYLLNLRDLQATFSRMEAQKPWPRMWQEFRRLLGVHEI